MRLANLTDYQLQGCNRWQLPNGAIKLAIARVIPFYQFINATQVLNDLEVGTPPDHDFVCKVVSSTGVTPGTLVQIQWPDGRYLSNPGVDFFSFVGTGRRGRLISPHKFMPKNSKIRINLDNSLVASNANMEIYFEGVILVDMV
jgi:hypothetical protein